MIQLGKIGFSMECFIVYFSKFSSTTVENCLLRGLGICHQLQAFQGISWNFLISWDPKIVSVLIALQQDVFSSHDNNFFKILVLSTVW